MFSPEITHIVTIDKETVLAIGRCIVTAIIVNQFLRFIIKVLAS